MVATQQVVQDSVTTLLVKSWQHIVSFGINLGNVLEFNSSNGVDKKNFSLNTSLDLGLNYIKEGSKFAMNNLLFFMIVATDHFLNRRG